MRMYTQVAGRDDTLEELEKRFWNPGNNEALCKDELR